MDVPNQGLGKWTEKPWHQTAKCLMKETHIHTNVENLSQTHDKKFWHTTGHMGFLKGKPFCLYS